MPGFQKLAKKNAAYAKRSVKNEDWQFNGAGQPVFIGNPNVSQFNPGGSVSPGASYLPDEVAKMLVKESGLRKSDTIPQRVIISYLESMRLSRGLAADVAQVLRDVYGITPTFDEFAKPPLSAYPESLMARSGALIEELSAVSESYPMPFAVEVEGPEELNEVDFIGNFIQGQYVESKDAVYDLVLANIALLTPEEFCDVVDFYDWVGEEVFNYIEQIAVDGPDGAAENIVEGLCWPHRIQFMPEDIQSLFEDDGESGGFAAIAKHVQKQRENGLGSLGSLGKHLKAQQKQQNKLSPADAKKRQMSQIPSARKQMKLHAKDSPDIQKADPLAAKKKAHDEINKGFSKKRVGAIHTDPQLHAKSAALRAKKDSEKVASPSRMKRAGATAVGLMKKVGSAAKSVGGAVKSAAGAVKSAAGAVHDAGKYVAPGVRKVGHAGAVVAGGVAKAGVHAAAGLAGAAGHVAGSAIHHLVKGAFGSKSHADDSGAKSKRGGAASEPEHKPGLVHRALGHIAHAVGEFGKHMIHHIKQGYKDATPGIQSQLHKDSDAESAPKKKERVDSSPVREAAFRSGNLLNEMAGIVNGNPVNQDEDLVRSPADVIQAFEATTVVDLAILEAVGEMEWTQIAGIAGFVVLESERFLSLIQSAQEGTTAFRSEWSRMAEDGVKPAWMDIGSFMILSKLSLDETVIPRVVYWAARTIQGADEGVASYVAEAYPELGQTVYGPAGDPKEGPQLARSFMTPQPAGTMTPVDNGCTTRMFSDPEEREKERKERLADVMSALDDMRTAAAEAGVPPEGMFLNVYRDMQRERVRYS